ncbi:MAG TPA: hypothetical protein VFS67_20735 [Polyangiaceae bacterium]|jgi:hypothetical protein|nr:hypothetical protein [Polyangiaceae bacterium]
MRRFVTVGVFSLATVLYGACSDDGGDGGIGGNGGTGASGGSAGSGAGAGAGGSAGTGNIAGSSGTAGQGGTAGTAGSAGAAGTAGAGGTGGPEPDAGDAGVDGDSGVGDGGLGDGGLGDAAVAPPCTGCLELRAPLAAPSESAYFQLAFASKDLSDTVATFRLRSLAFDETGQTLITPFATSTPDGNAFTQGNGTTVLNNAAAFTNTDTFIDVQLDIGAIATSGFLDTNVVALGIQILAGGSYAGPEPTLLLDSVTFTGSGGLTNLDFTTDAQGFARNNFAGIQTAEVIHH